MTVSTTLGGTITATAGVLHLASTSDLTSFPATLHIDAAGDAELVIARAIARNGEITVDRGAYGSTRQAHSAGVTVTTYEPGGGGGGGSGVTVDPVTGPEFDATRIVAAGATESAPGEATLGALSFQLLGPVHVTWETAGLDSGFGVEVGAIPAGAFLIAGLVVPNPYFDGGGGTTLIGALFQLSDGIDGSAVLSYDVWNTTTPLVPSKVLVASALNPSENVSALYAVAANLSVYCKIAGDDGLTQGEADIFAIIATPA